MKKQIVGAALLAASMFSGPAMVFGNPYDVDQVTGGTMWNITTNTYEPILGARLQGKFRIHEDRSASVALKGTAVDRLTYYIYNGPQNPPTLMVRTSTVKFLIKGKFNNLGGPTTLAYGVLTGMVARRTFDDGTTANYQLGDARLIVNPQNNSGSLGFGGSFQGLGTIGFYSATDEIRFSINQN